MTRETHQLKIFYILSLLTSAILPLSSFLTPQDKTFTATLFMPYAKFDVLETADDISDFFMAEFPDFVPLLGRCVHGLGRAGPEAARDRASHLPHIPTFYSYSENLVKQFLENPTGQLVTVKCDPLATRRVALMGDASHAIVPFYGQGMNAVRQPVFVDGESGLCLSRPHQQMPFPFLFRLQSSGI